MENLLDLLRNEVWQLLGAIASLLGTLTAYLISREAYKARKRELAKQGINFRERMEKLTNSLAQASSEVDKILEEMTMVSRVREETLKNLESRLDELSEHEEELQTRIESLQSVSIPAVEHFIEAVEKGEKRSASRDYILFGAGVIVSTVITIVLKLMFNI